METSEGRPAWQVEPCPGWCVVLHASDDHERDRKHISAALSVPVRQLRAGKAGADGLFAEPEPGTGDEHTVSTDLAVCLHRRDGARTTWVYVGDGTDQLLELTLESVVRLMPALDRVLDLARA